MIPFQIPMAAMCGCVFAFQFKKGNARVD